MKAEPAKHKRVAVILAGAVAKGAFEAGALSVLAQRDLCVVRIVAASSGALNGVCYAAGVRSGTEAEAADKLVRLWRDNANWRGAFHVNVADILQREGFSDQQKLLELLRNNVAPASGAVRAPIDLHIVVAPLGGAPGRIKSDEATSYERALAFADEDFDDAARLEAVFRAAVASSSFPGVYAPMDLGGDLGPCVDGGTVNNTPIKYALQAARLDAVIVIAPTVEQLEKPCGELRGLDLAGHLADMLINERLYRDLHDAEDVNTALEALEKLRPKLGTQVIDDVYAALNWSGRRNVPILRIRPCEPLPGNAFSGFFDRTMRETYVARGIEQATVVLDGFLRR